MKGMILNFLSIAAIIRGIVVLSTIRGGFWEHLYPAPAPCFPMPSSGDIIRTENLVAAIIGVALLAAGITHFYMRSRSIKKNSN